MNRRDALRLVLIPLIDRGEAMSERSAGALVEQECATSFATTLDRLVAAIEGAGMTVFARIDHAAAERTAALAMPHR